MDEPARASVPAVDPAISSLAFRSIAVAIVISTIVSRGLTVALRGWRIGMDDAIARTDQLAATLSQLVVVAGAFLAIRLLVPTLRDRELGLWYRLGVAPIVPAVVTTVFAAATGQLGHVMTLAFALAASVIAVAAAVAALPDARTRAAGIVLGLCGVGALVKLVAHTLGVRAGDAALESLFAVARWLCSFGFVLDVVSVLLVLLWLAAKNRVRLAVLSTTVLGFGVLIAWLSHRGATALDVGGRYDVLIARSVAELVRHPRPFVPTVVSYALEASALCLALLCAFDRTRGALAASAISLVLAARMATDIPVHGLALVVGALLTPLAALRVVSTPQNPPSSRTDAGPSPGTPAN